MSVSYIGIDSRIPTEELTDESGNWLSHPLFDDDILPLFWDHAASIDRVILIETKWQDIDVKKLAKLTSSITIEKNLVTLEGLEYGNSRLMEFIRYYAGWVNELNLLFQSRDVELLKEFILRFPYPYRKWMEVMDGSPSGRAAPALVDIERLVSQLDDDSYLITSAIEGQLYCLFAHERIQNLILSWK